MGKIWAFASGSGGTGKTSIALAMAIGAAHKGMKTILLDASGIARSCDLMLGIESLMTVDLIDAMSEQMDIGAALYPVAQCSGLYLTNASLHENVSLEAFSGILLALQSMCDILIIDLPSCQTVICDHVMTSMDELIFILRPDDASMRSAERIMQQARGCRAGLSLVLNRVRKDSVKKGLQYSPDAVSMTLDCPVICDIPEGDTCMLDIAAGKAVRSAMRFGSPLKEILAYLLR